MSNPSQNDLEQPTGGGSAGAGLLSSAVELCDRVDAALEVARRQHAERQRAIGLIVRGVRESRNIKLREVARRCKWSAMYVSHLEAGKRHWSPAVIVRISAALDNVQSPGAVTKTKPDTQTL